MHPLISKRVKLSFKTNSSFNASLLIVLHPTNAISEIALQSSAISKIIDNKTIACKSTFLFSTGRRGGLIIILARHNAS